MLTREQLLEHNIWVADNFDEEFVIRFKLGQKILVTFKLDNDIHYEILMLGTDNHSFYKYEIPQDKWFPILIENEIFITYKNETFRGICVEELSLEWLNNFICLKNY